MSEHSLKMKHIHAGAKRENNKGATQRVKASGEPQELHFPVVGSVLLVAIALLRLLIFAPGLHL